MAKRARKVLAQLPRDTCVSALLKQSESCGQGATRVRRARPSRAQGEYSMIVEHRVLSLIHWQWKQLAMAQNPNHSATRNHKNISIYDATTGANITRIRSTKIRLRPRANRTGTAASESLRRDCLSGSRRLRNHPSFSHTLLLQ